MAGDKGKTKPEKVLPEGLTFVNFNILLYAIGMSVTGGFIVGRAGTSGGILLLVFIFILCLVAIVSRRKARKFLKENGELEITFTFSPAPANKVKKKILFRDVGEIIDDCIDRVLD